MADKIQNLKNWVNNERLNARDYVHERNLVADTVNEIIVEQGVQDNRLDVIETEVGIGSETSRIDDLETNKLNRDGTQPMTGNLVMSGNNITDIGKAEDTTFESGALDTDAIRYSDLANVFDVTPGDKSDLITEIADKFDAYQTKAGLSTDFYTKTQTDNLLDNKVDVNTYTSKVNQIDADLLAVQGAYVFRGKLTTATTEQVEADKTLLTTFISDEFEGRQPTLGDVVKDNDGGEWYFDGTDWRFMGQDYINLDDYYTKTDSDNRYYTQTQLDNGELDDRYYTEGEVDSFLADKVDVGVLASSIVIYPTTTESDVTGYFRGVTSITDGDYDTTAVDVTTPTVNGIKVPVGVIIADSNLFVGNPGVINVPIVGNVRSSANNVEAEFYFELYKRDSLGNEVLLGESTKTKTVVSQAYEEFSATGLLNNGEFASTDRLVIKFFADKVGSVNGTFDFQYGGTSPIRILLNVPIDVTLQAGRIQYDNTSSGFTSDNLQDVIDELPSIIENVIDSVDALRYIGVFDAANASEFPSGDKLHHKGDLYKVSSNGVVDGVDLEVGDIIICNTDGTVAGETANWDVLEGGFDQSLVQDHLDSTSNPHDTSLSNLTDTTITNPTTNHALVHDGTDFKNRVLTKTDVGLNNVLNYGIASQEEAEAGVLNDKYMTPYRTEQQINKPRATKYFTDTVTIQYDSDDDSINFTFGV